MGCCVYVAKKYDVDFQRWLRWRDFDRLFNAWEDLYEQYGSGEWSYSTDDYNNWYALEKDQLQELLKVLETFVERDGNLYPPEVDTSEDAAASIITVDVRDRLREILAIAADMDHVRVEVGD